MFNIGSMVNFKEFLGGFLNITMVIDVLEGSNIGDTSNRILRF